MCGCDAAERSYPGTQPAATIQHSPRSLRLLITYLLITWLFHQSPLTNHQSPFHSAVSPLRYTLRLLLKSPGFTITAILILGFGIGANTAIFSLIDTVLLTPLPYPEPEKMAVIYMPSESAPDEFFDYPDYLDYVASQHTFSALGLSAWDWLDVVQNGNAERIKCSFVTAGAFQAFGVPIIIGRPFTAEEEQPGGPLLAVISEPFWRTHFSADPNIIGKNIVLNGYSLQIIGVSKPINSDYNEPPRVLLPLNTVDVVSDWGNWRGRDNHSMFLCRTHEGRCHAGSSPGGS
jgi:MacB-like periplasmic core domain